MFQLIYISTASSLFSDDMLEHILVTSRRNNAAAAITGLLLYHEGGILQMLEGSKEKVTELMLRIQQDTRHYGIMYIMERETSERHFAQWSMGFRKLSAKNWTDLEGYLPVVSSPTNTVLINPHQQDEFITFIRSFYKANFGQTGGEPVW